MIVALFFVGYVAVMVAGACVEAYLYPYQNNIRPMESMWLIWPIALPLLGACWVLDRIKAAGMKRQERLAALKLRVVEPHSTDASIREAAEAEVEAILNENHQHRVN